MTDLSRREALAASALATAAVAMPAWAQDRAAATGADVAQWDLTDLYASDAAWETARKELLAAIPALAKNKGKLGQGADVVAAQLVAQSDMGRKTSRLYTYASLNADADLRVSANQEKEALARDVFVAYGEATAWVTPEILSLGKPKIQQYLAANATLRDRFDLTFRDILREADHTLSPEGEQLLAGVGAPFAGPSDIRGQLVASDIPWPTVTLSTGKKVRLDDQTYTLNRDAPVRADRKLVFDAFWGEYGKFQNSLGAAYLAHVKADVFRMRARKYPTSLADALSGNNIPEGVYRTLVAETNKGLPELHRYFELRRKMLKLPDMAYYDIYPPLVQLDRKVTVPEMRTTVLEAMKPLGSEYVGMMSTATAGKWMDPLPRPGKRSGAYMNPGAAYDVHPYLLLNLGENYEGMSTYAHEWGHAMHTLLADKNQIYDKSDYPIFLAEIASTCNEQLLAAYMVAQAKTRQEKLFYLGQQLESIRGTFYRQTMFAEFELAAHDKAEAGEGLSGERFSAMYLDLLKRYHGPKVAMSPTYASEWAYIPHFYNSFYVYQYATCIAAASYFARAILKGGAKERDNYLGVLEGGRIGLSGRYPEAGRPRYGIACAISGDHHDLHRYAGSDRGVDGMTNGRMNVRHILTGSMIGLALALAACDPAPSGNDAAAVANDTVPALPAFAVDSDTALAQIKALGEPWADAKRSDPMRDAKTGGLVNVLTSDGGSAQVFSRPEGKVWQVRVTTGAPNNCGSSEPLIAAMPKLVGMLKPGLTLSDADTLALGNGMTDLRPTTRDLDGMKATVVGGCTHWLTLAVPDEAVPAPAAG